MSATFGAAASVIQGVIDEELTIRIHQQVLLKVVGRKVLSMHI